MGDPSWHALWADDRPEEDVELPDGRERLRRGGTVWVTGRHIRDAALGVLVQAWGARSIDQILQELAERRIGIGSRVEPRQAVADALRYQARIGRAVRVRRGVYAIGRLPRTTEWRLVNRLVDRSWPWAYWERAAGPPPIPSEG